jgi:hypothetical protein
LIEDVDPDHISAALLDRTYGGGLFPTCLYRNAFTVPTSGRGSVSATCLWPTCI